MIRRFFIYLQNKWFSHVIFLVEKINIFESYQDVILLLLEIFKTWIQSMLDNLGNKAIITCTEHCYGHMAVRHKLLQFFWLYFFRKLPSELSVQTTWRLRCFNIDRYVFLSFSVFFAHYFHNLCTCLKLDLCILLHHWQ